MSMKLFAYESASDDQVIYLEDMQDNIDEEYDVDAYTDIEHKIIEATDSVEILDKLHENILRDVEEKGTDIAYEFYRISLESVSKKLGLESQYTQLLALESFSEATRSQALEFALEGIGDAIKTGIGKIKDFFKMLLEQLMKFWNYMFNNSGAIIKKLEDLKSKINAMEESLPRKMEMGLPSSVVDSISIVSETNNRPDMLKAAIEYEKTYNEIISRLLKPIIKLTADVSKEAVEQGESKKLLEIENSDPIKLPFKKKLEVKIKTDTEKETTSSDIPNVDNKHEAHYYLPNIQIKIVKDENKQTLDNVFTDVYDKDQLVKLIDKVKDVLKKSDEVKILVNQLKNSVDKAVTTFKNITSEIERKNNLKGIKKGMDKVGDVLKDMTGMDGSMKDLKDKAPKADVGVKVMRDFEKRLTNIIKGFSPEIHVLFVKYAKEQIRYIEKCISTIKTEAAKDN